MRKNVVIFLLTEKSATRVSSLLIDNGFSVSTVSPKHRICYFNSMKVSASYWAILEKSIKENSLQDFALEIEKILIENEVPFFGIVAYDSGVSSIPLEGTIIPEVKNKIISNNVCVSSFGKKCLISK